MARQSAGEEVKQVATNRKALHDYFLEDVYEAGIALTGTEIKSVRAARVNLRDGFVQLRNGEAWLINVHISPYDFGNRENHEPRRERKLLLHRHQIDKLYMQQQQKKLTMVPLALYFKRGMLKVELGLARGKKLYDKRQDMRKKFADRDMKRATGRGD